MGALVKEKEMKVVNVDVKKVDFGNKMRAFADVTLSLLDDGDGCITLRGFRLFDGANGPFLAMPSEKVTIKDKETGKDEIKWFDRIYIDKEVEEGKALLDAITEAVVVDCNSQGEAKTKSAKKKADTAAGGSPEDDDIPW